jgi:hypothetical protein
MTASALRAREARVELGLLLLGDAFLRFGGGGHGMAILGCVGCAAGG